MKNSSNESVITGKLIFDNPITIDIDVLSGSEDCQDNIQCLNDLGYVDDVEESIRKKENVELAFDGWGFLNNNIEIITSEAAKISAHNKYKNSKNKDDEPIKEGLRMLLEFCGTIVDARESK
jgi:hypothetical protein